MPNAEFTTGLNKASEDILALLDGGGKAKL